MPVSKEAEERIIKAACLLVRADVVAMCEREEPNCRGSLRLGQFLEEQTRTRLVAAIRVVSEELASSALVEMKSWIPEAPPAITGRISQLSNELPCTVCGEVRRVAIHDIREGQVFAVECERCCPEYRGT